MREALSLTDSENFTSPHSKDPTCPKPSNCAGGNWNVSPSCQASNCDLGLRAQVRVELWLTERQCRGKDTSGSPVSHLPPQGTAPNEFRWQETDPLTEEESQTRLLPNVALGVKMEEERLDVLCWALHRHSGYSSAISKMRGQKPRMKQSKRRFGGSFITKSRTCIGGIHWNTPHTELSPSESAQQWHSWEAEQMTPFVPT